MQIKPVEREKTKFLSENFWSRKEKVTTPWSDTNTGGGVKILLPSPVMDRMSACGLLNDILTKYLKKGCLFNAKFY